MTLVIPQAILTEIKTRAIASQPDECCGLLGGSGTLVQTHYPLRNVAEHPQRRYFAAPEDLFAAMRRMRAGGERMLGIYHSHPHGPAHPSATDLAMAFYPEAVYLIIALKSEAEVCAFSLKGSAITEIEIEVSA
jgi:proteasome lid subunit RPN8/RPN11